MGKASEAILAKLCKRSFLSFWSYPSPYNNKDLGRKKEGKEHCDLLVIFGDEVLIFSDKDRAYTANQDDRVSWNRWYRKAVAASIVQLEGAESWIRRYPDQLFSDRLCTCRLEVPIPPPERLRVHRICIVSGAREACAALHEL